MDTQEAVESSTIVYSNESSETLTNSERSTAPATETVSQKATITIGSKVFTFIVNGLTIEHDSSRTGKMTELSHEFPVIVWNGNSFFDKFYKVQNFFPYAIPIVLDNEPPRM